MHLHAVGKKTAPRHEAGRLKLDHYITHRFKGVEGGDRGRSPWGTSRRDALGPPVGNLRTGISHGFVAWIPSSSV